VVFLEHPRKEFMRKCVELAIEAAKLGHYPIASLVVDGSGNVISLQKNVLLSTTDPTAHPEILAIRKATRKKNSRYIEDCVLYTTLEPCPMCTSAAIWAKMSGIVFGANQQDALEYSEKHPSTVYTFRQILVPSKLIVEHGTPKLKLYENFMREECVALFELTQSKYSGKKYNLNREIK